MRHPNGVARIGGMRTLILAAAMLAFTACDKTDVSDPTLDDAGGADAALVDGGASDGATTDGGTADGAVHDGGASD